jgi:O-antigen/teichoic acid export membrane protein
MGVSANELSTSGVSVVDRVGRGLGALSLTVAIQALGQIAIVPVALYAWGKIRYGEWIVLTGLVTVLKITDLGLQTFVVNRMCASFARGDRAEMQRDLSNALRVQIPLVLAIALACALILIVLPLQRLLDLQTVAGTTLYFVAMLLMIELLMGVPMGVLAGIYRATGRLARAGVIGAFQQLALLGSTIALIAGSASFATVAAVRVAIGLIVSIWILFDLRRLYPWLHLFPKNGKWREGARMIGPGIFFILIPLADYLSTQITLMVVQGSLAGGEVTRLATHRTVVNLAMMVSGLLTSSMWPELTSLHARSQKDKLIKAHRSLARMNMWLVGVVAIGILPFLPLIYPSWTAGRLTIDSWTLGFLVSRMLLWGAWSASMILLCAINHQKSVAVALIGAGILTSIFSLLLVPKIGISGAALAQLAGDVCVSAWLIPWLAAKETQDRLGSFLSQTLRALLTGILIPIAIGLLGWRLIESQPVRLFILFPAVAAIAFALMWTQLATHERAHLFRLVRTKFA